MLEEMTSTVFVLPVHTLCVSVEMAITTMTKLQVSIY